MPPSTYIGTAGYVYPHWRKGAFYPLALPHNKELAHYFENFCTVEINTTWHAFPRSETLLKWRATAPQSALLSLKAPKLITHEKRLRNVTHHVVAFCKLVVDALQSNLGAVLFQCPPSLSYSPVLLDCFIADLQRAAQACHPVKLRVAVDFRHPSWFCQHVLQRLAQHDIALVDNVVVHDHQQTVINHNHLPNARQHAPRPASSWSYLRFHGSKNPSVLTNFPDCVLAHFAERSVQQGGSPHFAFFLNDWGAFAPKNAQRYAQLMAKRRRQSVTSLFHGFCPLWCRKRPSLASFFGTRLSAAPAKRRRASAPNALTELPRRADDRARGSTGGNELSNDKLHTQLDGDRSEAQPVSTQQHQHVVAVQAPTDGNERGAMAGLQRSGEQVALHIPEMRSESEQSAAEKECSSSTPMQHDSASQAHRFRRQGSAPSSKGVVKGAKPRVKASPKRKGKRVRKTKVDGVADIGSFFAAASEKD